MDGWTDAQADWTRGLLPRGGTGGRPALHLPLAGAWRRPHPSNGSHSLSESVSYWEHSSGLGSSSQAGWGPVGRPGGGGEAMTPACSRMSRGL